MDRGRWVSGGLMLKWTLILAVVVLGAGCLPGMAGAEIELPEIKEIDGVFWAGPAWRQDVEGLRILYLTGTSKEMGIQQGLLSSDEAEELRQAVRELDPGYAAEGFLERLGWMFRNLYARFQFMPKFRSHIPDAYLEEMEGFVLGASGGTESNYYEVLMSNVSQDLSIAAPGCSAVAAWGEATVDGELYIGRNLDHPVLMALAEMQYLAVYSPSEGYRFVVHGYPSHIGTMSGMNEKGVMISSNYSMAVRSERNIDGMPYMIMLRQVLQYAADLDEAISIISSTPRTIGLNLMVADASNKKAVVVEVSANRMAIREAENYIYSSNMYQDPYMKQYQAPGWLASALRDQRFAELKDKYWGSIDVEVVRDILRDKLPSPDGERQWFNSSINNEVNMASMVFVPGRGEAWTGVVSGEEVPFAADGAFVGIDVRGIWETGQPQEILGLLPGTERVGFDKYWFETREAKTMFDKHRLEEGMDLVDQVLAEYPDAGFPTYLKGRIHGRGGDLEKAIPYLEKFVAMPDHQEPYYLRDAAFWLAVSADHLGYREKAKSYYQLVLQIEIDDLTEGDDFFRNWAKTGLDRPLKIGDGGRVVTR